MAKPEECPKCKANQDYITNAFDMCDCMGISRDNAPKEWMCGECHGFFDSDEVELKSWYDAKDFSKMTLSQISDVIFTDWRDMSPQAFQYADAMRDLDNMESMFGSDSASVIVAYFLTNAKHWKTETAKEIKKVLQKMLKEYEKTI